jgi:hypothetical protein
MSICNFRCSYCYLAQRPVHYQGVQPEMKYTPAEVANALTVERVGGPAFMNFCADGETLLTTNIDLYVKALVEQGHYAEVVTNLTITPVLKKFLSWDKELLKRLEFKCSFHYLELKKKGLLDTFANNVRMIWEAGASANIEMMPSDDLIPYIEEVKEFSMKHFGALPQLSIVRNDRTSGIDYLTSLPMEKYNNTWGQFHSDFWEFKKSIFGVKQTKFCYAGAWSLYINLCDGTATQCYCGVSLGDVFAHPYKPIPSKPIGKCTIAHCYNGHAFMTLGLIPGYTKNYGNIRNRVKEDGNQWLQPELLSFFNSKLEDSNAIYPPLKQLAYLSKERLTRVAWRGVSFVKRCVRKIIQ